MTAGPVSIIPWITTTTTFTITAIPSGLFRVWVQVENADSSSSSEAESSVDTPFAVGEPDHGGMSCFFSATKGASVFTFPSQAFPGSLPSPAQAPLTLCLSLVHPVSIRSSRFDSHSHPQTTCCEFQWEGLERAGVLLLKGSRVI